MSELEQFIAKLCDDEPHCLKCSGYLDTGWECTECGHDNRPYYYPAGAADDAIDAARNR